MGQSCYGSVDMMSVVVSAHDAAGTRHDGVDMAYRGGIIS